ncbi:MAG: hypothetical protein QXW45_06740 [Thermosphaera sp.]
MHYIRILLKHHIKGSRQVKTIKENKSVLLPTLIALIYPLTPLHK